MWRESGYVFTRPDGRPYHPNYFTHRLQHLIKRCGLPPVRLHDLRHGAASLAHGAGTDLKTIQDQLGHASVEPTADTYTTVLPTACTRPPRQPPGSSTPPPEEPAPRSAARPIGIAVLYHRVPVAGLVPGHEWHRRRPRGANSVDRLSGAVVPDGAPLATNSST